jgi:hypothetical protein
MVAIASWTRRQLEGGESTRRLLQFRDQTNRSESHTRLGASKCRIRSLLRERACHRLRPMSERFVREQPRVDARGTTLRRSSTWPRPRSPRLSYACICVFCGGNEASVHGALARAPASRPSSALASTCVSTLRHADQHRRQSPAVIGSIGMPVSPDRQKNPGICCLGRIARRGKYIPGRRKQAGRRPPELHPLRPTHLAQYTLLKLGWRSP